MDQCSTPFHVSELDWLKTSFCKNTGWCFGTVHCDIVPQLHCVWKESVRRSHVSTSMVSYNVNLPKSKVHFNCTGTAQRSSFCGHWHMLRCSQSIKNVSASMVADIKRKILTRQQPNCRHAPAARTLRLLSLPKTVNDSHPTLKQCVSHNNFARLTPRNHAETWWDLLPHTIPYLHSYKSPPCQALRTKHLLINALHEPYQGQREWRREHKCGW